jgi:hypothetical protein
MKKSLIIRAIIAFLITISAAYYQKKTGPTYPVDIETKFERSEISGQLTRSHGGDGDQPLQITALDTSIKAVLIYRRFKAADDWVGMKMERIGNDLQASLPHQPPAGKLEYFIQLTKNSKSKVLPEAMLVVTRFKGAVPNIILIPHIFLMFFAMFLSTWAGLEAAFKSETMYQLAFWATGLLFLGGMILGPVVQKYAFGALWTGIPFGFDLTDNKTLLTMVVWGLAAWMSYKRKSARLWIIGAALVLLLVYSIPHSVMGSELDYKTMEVKVGQ